MMYICDINFHARAFRIKKQASCLYKFNYMSNMRTFYVEIDRFDDNKYRKHQS